MAREGSNVSLSCQATGFPQPNITWKREDGSQFTYNGQTVTAVESDVLQLSKASRLHMGPYLCIASNGVPPSVSQRIPLKIQFPPMLWIPNQLEAAYVGQDVMLECHIEAYPKSINYWTTAKGDMIISGEKYESVSSDDSYRVYMRLKIRRVSQDDFGSYQCVAKNSLGETDGTIKLYEIPDPVTTSSSVPSKHYTESIRHSKKKDKKKTRNNKHSKGQNIHDSVLAANHDENELLIEDEASSPTAVSTYLGNTIESREEPHRSSSTSSQCQNPSRTISLLCIFTVLSLAT